MNEQKITVKTFHFSQGTTAVYCSVCSNCHKALGEPTKAGALICPNCGKKTLLPLLGNKF